MSIRLIFNLSLKNPLLTELATKLQIMGHEVCVYDFISCKKFIPSDGSFALIDATWWSPYVLKLRYLRRLFIPLIAKKCIKKEFFPGDVVNIHYVQPAYVRYVNLICEKGCKLIITVWGSDYLRATSESKAHLKVMFDRANRISMVEGVRNIFVTENPKYLEKTRVTYFGLKIIDILEGINHADIVDFCERHQIDIHKLSICVGYNASPAQQHKVMIRAVSKLSPDLQHKIHLLIPLTYGGTVQYIKEIKKLTEELSCSYSLLLDFMSDKDVALLRKISSIVVNFQVTDAFSGALTESLASGSLALVGSWLPYSKYDDLGIKLLRSNQDSLGVVLNHAILNFYKLQKEFCDNAGKARNAFSWHRTLDYWINVYEEA